MGIPTDPGYKLYVGDYCHCWPVGETPKKLWVSVTGVKVGSLWAPGDPAPPNQIFIVEYDTACAWIWTGATFVLTYVIQPAFSALMIMWGTVAFAFNSNLAGVCAGKYTNSLTYAGNYFYDGIASISQRELL